MNKEPPREIRRKAVVKSNHSAASLVEELNRITKEVKLLINKNIETVVCVVETVEKSCSIKPYKINLTNCKYGSS